MTGLRNIDIEKMLLILAASKEVQKLFANAPVKVDVRKDPRMWARYTKKLIEIQRKNSPRCNLSG